ncbi:MAG: mechanosensitive ion channel [Myxococcales bacterium]|nr:mechanosensitive ion channel [Myxococcales bacterium]
MTGLPLDLTLVLVGGALLAAALYALRAVIDILPLARATQNELRRAFPASAALLALVYLLIAVSYLFQEQPIVAAVAVVLVLAAFVAASWSSLHDLASGVVLKAGEVLRVGDHVTLDELQGRVTRMGLLALVLETNDGEEALIPYRRVGKERILRSPTVEGPLPHVFRVAVENGTTLAELKAAIRLHAMLAHFAAVSRAPEFVVADDGELEVTIYTIDPDRGPEVEALIRAALPHDKTPATA